MAYKDGVAISLMVLPEDFKLLKIKASREGFSSFGQHGVGRMFNSMAHKIAQDMVQRPDHFHREDGKPLKVVRA